jgi:hypothetical protein
MQERGHSDGTAVRITVFSLTLALVPVLGLVWVRYVWQEAGRPDVTVVELAARSAVVVAAGVLVWAALYLAGAVLVAVARRVEAGVEALGRRLHL